MSRTRELKTFCGMVIVLSESNYTFGVVEIPALYSNDRSWKDGIYCVLQSPPFGSHIPVMARGVLTRGNKDSTDGRLATLDVFLKLNTVSHSLNNSNRKGQ